MGIARLCYAVDLKISSNRIRYSMPIAHAHAH